jgi:hypothetical protein
MVWLDHVVVLFFKIFWRISILLSNVVGLIYFPINSLLGLLFFHHKLTNICSQTGSFNLNWKKNDILKMWRNEKSTFFNFLPFFCFLSASIQKFQVTLIYAGLIRVPILPFLCCDLFCFMAPLKISRKDKMVQGFFCWLLWNA